MGASVDMSATRVLLSACLPATCLVTGAEAAARSLAFSSAMVAFCEQPLKASMLIMDMARRMPMRGVLVFTIASVKYCRVMGDYINIIYTCA